jgi:hypothetical protein
MPTRDTLSPRSVLTLHNGHSWINEVGSVGPVPGSFARREAAVAVGRALAMDAGTTHVIHDETGAVVEAASYKAASCLTRRSEISRASPTVVRTSSRLMSSRT